MKFDWRRFTETDYKNMLDGKEDFGQVYVGDICIELVVEAIGSFIHDIFNVEEIIYVNFYVLHEDTGYGYKDEHGVNTDGIGIPYDYADGFSVARPYGLSYDEFKAKLEKLSMEYIEAYRGSYSLVEHANRPLEIW